MAYIGYGPCSYDAYIAMAYVVMACVVMAYIVTAYVVMAYIVIACIAMACIVMAHIVMAYIVTAYTVTAGIPDPGQLRCRCGSVDQSPAVRRTSWPHMMEWGMCSGAGSSPLEELALASLV